MMSLFVDVCMLWCAEVRRQLSGAVSYLPPCWGRVSLCCAMFSRPADPWALPLSPSVESGVTDACHCIWLLRWGLGLELSSSGLCCSQLFNCCATPGIVDNFFFHSICFRISGVYNPPLTPVLYSMYSLSKSCYLIWVSHNFITLMAAGLLEIVLS